MIESFTVKKLNQVCLFSALTLIFLQYTSCSRQSKNYEYIERGSEKVMPDVPEKNFAHIHAAFTGVIWSKPASFTPATGDAMRLATFKSGDVEISLSVFPGDTGGMQANLKRWAGQISLNLSAEDMAKLMKSLEEVPAKLPHVVVDYTPLSGGGESILAGVFSFEDQTLFVKAKGPARDLSAMKKTFADFCASIQIKE